MVNNAPLRVFVDNCIISISGTAQGAQRPQKINWGGKEYSLQIHGFERKPLPKESESWKREQVECMPTIGRLARQRVIALSSYMEITLEGFKRRHPLLINVFDGVEIEHVDAAVERSYFFQSSIDKYIDKQSMIKFCKFLLGFNPDEITEKTTQILGWPDFLVANLRNIKRFKALCKGLSENQYPDAFHLWTAELNGADCFLTIDKKFIQVMTKTNQTELPCLPLSPSQLLDQLGIDERDPFEHREGVFYNIFKEHAVNINCVPVLSSKGQLLKKFHAALQFFRRGRR